MQFLILNILFPSFYTWNKMSFSVCTDININMNINIFHSRACQVQFLDISVQLFIIISFQWSWAAPVGNMIWLLCLKYVSSRIAKTHLFPSILIIHLSVESLRLCLPANKTQMCPFIFLIRFYIDFPMIRRWGTW